LYTVTYLEFALKFLQKKLYLVNLNAEEFKSELLAILTFNVALHRPLPRS